MEDIIIQVPEHVTAFLRNLSNKIITLDNVIPRPEQLLKASDRQILQRQLIYKSSAFGGFILPEGTEKGATLHVASLNLNTLNHEDFVVQLNFSCNIITSKIKLRLRFQLLSRKRDSAFPLLSVPAYYITGTRKVPRQIVLPYRHMIVIRKPVHAATIAPV